MRPPTPQILDFGVRILDFGFRILDFGFRILDFGIWILDFGFRILDVGFGTELWILHEIRRLCKPTRGGGFCSLKGHFCTLKV